MQSSGDLFMHVVVALGLASTGCLRIGFLRLALELACASGHCGLGACEPRSVLLTVCGVVYACVCVALGNPGQSYGDLYACCGCLRIGFLWLP